MNRESIETSGQAHPAHSQAQTESKLTQSNTDQAPFTSSPATASGLGTSPQEPLAELIQAHNANTKAVAETSLTSNLDPLKIHYQMQEDAQRAKKQK